MKFADLIRDMELKKIVLGSEGHPAEIIDVDCDSRQIQDGWGFVALKGSNTDGHDYARQAIDNGAVAIFSERCLSSIWHGPSVVFRDNPKKVMARLARRVHGMPDLEMPIIAVTGTNGKTTTTMLIRQLMMASGMGCGLIGTVVNVAGILEEKSVLTSPESTSFFRWIKKSLDAGDKALATEISSVAMSLDRVHGAEFRVGVFTNLTQDHLDFHETMDVYFRAKASLFSQCRVGLVNVDDEYGRQLLAENPKLIPYGIDSGNYRVKNLKMAHGGTSFIFITPKGEFSVESPLLGRFNVYNTIAALSALDLSGFELEVMLPNISALKGAPGRLERVDMGQSFGVMVDYAHTPDALEKLLGAGRDLLSKNGRLHVLFGCGGDRDRSKRHVMASAVLSGGADVIWHTSDNTRTEDPERILDDAAIGIPEEIRNDSDRYHRIADRALAVEAAIKNCRQGDLLLLAGKGHEPYQDVMGIKHPYSDRSAVEAVLKGGSILRPWSNSGDVC